MRSTIAFKASSGLFRCIALPLFAIFLAIPKAAFAVPVGAGPLLWSDEFSGSSVDATKWTARVGQGRDDYYTPQALSVSGGMLTIKTFTESGTHYNGWIDTSQTYLPTYGYFESRIQFNTSQGMWSAFWLQTPMWPNPIFGDPGASGTEIDVIEHRRVNSSGSDYRSRIHMANHWDGYGPEHQSSSSTQNKSGSGMGNGSWHTFGLLWEPTKYTFYFDDQPTWTHTTAISNRSEYMILSSEAQTDSWAGDIPAAGYGSLATSTTNMLVDYVRVYTLVSQPLLPGDFDHDGDVDGGDFVVWQTHFPTPSGATLSTGDADADGDIDGADFVAWQTHFPFTPALAAISAPEPPALVLAAMVCVSFCYLRRSRNKCAIANASSAGLQGG
ncbi:MAG: glycoside hydrolase family 16 protein [Pirellulales bacterium]|nr:glycoside hydrolase family 16 protein [Pirellulales bacterium]